MPQSSLGTQTENDQGPPRFTEVSISQAPRLSFSNTTMGLICILVTDIYRTCKTKGCGEKIKYTVRDKAQTEREREREREDPTKCSLDYVKDVLILTFLFCPQ